MAPQPVRCSNRCHPLRPGSSSHWQYLWRNVGHCWNTYGSTNYVMCSNSVVLNQIIICGVIKFIWNHIRILFFEHQKFGMASPLFNVPHDKLLPPLQSSNYCDRQTGDWKHQNRSCHVCEFDFWICVVTPSPERKFTVGRKRLVLE